MRKTLFILISAIAAVMAVSCAPKEQYANRAEKILAEINDPSSDYVVVISHRGDWRNYPENSIPAIESVIRMGVDMMELDPLVPMGSSLCLVLPPWAPPGGQGAPSRPRAPVALPTVSPCLHPQHRAAVRGHAAQPGGWQHCLSSLL